jgi:hypothetical protein
LPPASAGRQHHAGGARLAHAENGVVLAHAVLEVVALRTAGDQFAAVVAARVRQRHVLHQRRDHTRVGRAVHLLEHHAEQVVAGVVVGEVRARLEVERLVGDQRQQLLVRQFERLLLLPHLAEVGVALDAAAVVQQLADRDLLALQRELRHVAREIVVERQLLLFDEAQDRRGGELLGDRTDAEQRRAGRRHHVFGLGEAVALRHHDGRALRDADREADRVGLLHACLDQRFDLRQPRLLGARRGGEGDRGERTQQKSGDGRRRAGGAHAARHAMAPPLRRQPRP